jgi:hypothetical protein
VKCKTVRNIDVFAGCEPYVIEIQFGQGMKKIIPAGTLICRDEYPPADCVKLVQNGLAEPADDECRQACNMTAAQINDAKVAMDRLLAGKGPVDDDEDEEPEEDDE